MVPDLLDYTPYVAALSPYILWCAAWNAICRKPSGESFLSCRVGIRKLEKIGSKVGLMRGGNKEDKEGGKTRQGKARQDKARQGKARQGKTRQGKARQDKTSRTPDARPRQHPP